MDSSNKTKKVRIVENLENFIIKTVEYDGRIFETKDNFVVETSTGQNSVRLNNPSNFIDKALSEFDGKNVKIEITVKITEIDS